MKHIFTSTILSDGTKHSADPVSLSGLHLGGRRILVVDDSEDAARSIGELLQLWGHEVVLAHDAASALEKASTYLPDIIVLDIGLPGMNGYEVVERLRRDPLLAQTRFIALTGYGQDSDKKAAYEAGFHEAFTKPADFAELKAALAQ